MARFKGRPRWVQGLLSDGEHPHVDYKQVLPKQREFAKALCAAANAVALRREQEEFIFLVGVEEVVGTGGLVSGRVTGLFDPKLGSIRDIEGEKLIVVNAVRDVVPSPYVEIDECGTGTEKPFLAVRVRPTDAPHRVGDRYLVRRGSHTVPLEAHQLRQIFVKARTEAFIEELNEDNHLTQALRILLDEVASLSHNVTRIEFDLSDEATERRRSAQALEQYIEYTYERLCSETAASSELADLAGEVDEVRDSVHGLDERVAEETSSLRTLLSRVSTSTIETARREVTMFRRVTWARLCSWQREGLMSDAEWAAGSALFQAFFFDNVSSADVETVIAEHIGWSYRSERRRSSGINLLLDAACLAAVEAALGTRSGAAWMTTELEGHAFHEYSSLIALDNHVTLEPPVMNPDWDDETAVLVVSPDRVRAAVGSLGAEPFDLPSDVLVFRLSNCRAEMRLSDLGTALVLRPTPLDDRFPESAEFFRQLRRRLRRNGADIVRCFPGTGGQLATLAGERVVAAPPPPPRIPLPTLPPQLAKRRKNGR